MTGELFIIATPLPRARTGECVYVRYFPCEPPPRISISKKTSSFNITRRRIAFVILKVYILGKICFFFLHSTQNVVLIISNIRTILYTIVTITNGMFRFCCTSLRITQGKLAQNTFFFIQENIHQHFPT